MIAGRLAMFWRWIGALIVSGSPSLAYPAGRLQLLGVAAPVVRDAVGVVGRRVLDRDLHVIEAGGRQPLETLARQRDGRRDQIRVEADLGRLGDDRLQVLPHRRLAAREMELQHAELRRLRQHVEPHLRRQLACDALELERVGAIGTLQRAAMGQLCQHADRCADARLDRGGGAAARHATTTPLSASPCSMVTMSARIRSLGAL